MKHLELRNKLLVFVALIVYIAHYTLKHNWSHYQGWPSSYLGDLLCLPIVLSGALLIMQLLTRGFIKSLTFLQVFFSFVMISLYFEWFFPKYLNKGVADLWDILYYALGGIVFIVWINPKK